MKLQKFEIFFIFGNIYSRTHPELFSRVPHSDDGRKPAIRFGPTHSQYCS
jgi:hypothetical protein